MALDACASVWGYLLPAWLRIDPNSIAAQPWFVGNLLYKVSPHDPLAFGAALVVMMIASTAACLLPAWRAIRTDPAQALRD